MSCASCNTSLEEPYIICAECTSPKVQLCLQCFALGKEVGSHFNFHKYEVTSLVFHVLEQSWSARDELNLLSATEEHGFGNWDEIAKKIQGKTSDQCETHLIKHYIRGESYLPKFEVSTETCYRRPVKLKEGQYRPSKSDVEDILYSVGYAPARADFFVEYENFAELDMKNVVIDEQSKHDDEFQCYNADESHNCNAKLMKELNLVIVDIYYRKICEREWRKKFMRKYGLIDVASFKAFNWKYGKEEEVLRETLKKFMRFVKPQAFEKLVQGILHQKQLQTRILQLKDFRKCGLKKFKNVLIYEKFNKQREVKRKSKLLDEVLSLRDNPTSYRLWLQHQLNNDQQCNETMHSLPSIGRKQALPWDLTDTPCYNELTDVEKKLCSRLRILPELFIEYRKVLQKESMLSTKGLKLRTARDLLRIDVNKTRQLYEFFIKQGVITGQQ